MNESMKGNVAAPQPVSTVSQVLYESLCIAKNHYHHLRGINARMVEFLEGPKEDAVCCSTEADIHMGSGVTLIQKELTSVLADTQRELNIFEESIFNKL